MSIQDFMEETHKRAGGKKLSSAQEEIADFASMIYHGIRGGKTEQWVRQVSRLLIQNIAPTLSPLDTLKVIATIDGIVLTVLSEFFSEGTLIKKEEHKDEVGGKG